MLARPICGDSGAGVRCRLSHCSSGVMRHDVKLKSPPGLNQVSRRSLLRVTTVLCSTVDRDRTRRWIVISSSNGADTRRANKSLAATFEFSSIHVKEVKFERGRLMIGVRGEIELNERFRRERACPPRKPREKRTVPKGLHVGVWCCLPLSFRLCRSGGGAGRHSCRMTALICCSSPSIFNDLTLSIHGMGLVKNSSRWDLRVEAWVGMNDASIGSAPDRVR